MTVGLPMAMVARQILEGKYSETGVQLPLQSGLYKPVLKELESYDIRFVEEEIKISQKIQAQTGHNRT